MHFIIKLEKYDIKKTLIFKFHISLFVHQEGLGSHFHRNSNAIIAYFIYVLSQ